MMLPSIDSSFTKTPSVLSYTDYSDPLTAILQPRKKIRITSKSTDVASLKIPYPAATILSVSDFTSQFCMHADCHDVEQGRYKVLQPGKKLYTTGVATCVAIVAKTITTKKGVVKIGLAHFDGIEPDLSKFLKAVCTPEKSQVYLHVFGGYNSSIQEHMDQLEEAISDFSNISVIEKNLNPLNTKHSEFDQIEKIMDIAGFCLGVGIMESGNIQLTDFTINKLKTDPIFCDYETVMKEYFAMIKLGCTLQDMRELTQITWNSPDIKSAQNIKNFILKILQLGCPGQYVSSVLKYTKKSRYRNKSQIINLIKFTKIFSISSFDQSMLTGRVITTVYDYWQDNQLLS